MGSLSIVRGIYKAITASWSKQNWFTVVTHEFITGLKTESRIGVIPWRPLACYIGDWKGYARVVVNGNEIFSDSAAMLYMPSAGDMIELFPEVGVKTFSNSYIDRLNRVSGGGRFLKAVIVTESVSPPIKKYYVDNEREIVFEGNTFTPLSMNWSGFETSSSMSLAKMTVTVPNLGGEVIAYIEEIDILENDVEFLILHIDLLNEVNAVDRTILQIQTIEADDNIAAFTVGINLGLSDLLPREVIMKSEFPGLVDDVLRLGI
jgi:hypothetical protein